MDGPKEFAEKAKKLLVRPDILDQRREKESRRLVKIPKGREDITSGMGSLYKKKRPFFAEVPIFTNYILTQCI